MKGIDNKQQSLLKEIELMEERVRHITQQEACFKALGKGLPFALEDELSDLEVAISELYMLLDLK